MLTKLWRKGPARASTREEASARRIAALTESRREVAEAFELERRRIERDLHDGAQQYLVAAAMALGEARLIAEECNSPALDDALGRADHLVGEGLQRLRETVHGIHPSVLSESGLVAAIEDVAAKLPNPTKIRCPHVLPRLPEAVLAAGYFFAAEALTNAAKHAPGSPVSVLIVCDTHLRISVVDLGPGGAQMERGGGLDEMRRRVSAFDGELTLSSPPGGPTTVAASIPLLLSRGEPSFARMEQ